MTALAPEHRPLSPPPETGARLQALPAYVANGVIGLRVRENPLRPGMCLVSGLSGEHPTRHIEAASPAPYPLAADLCLNGVWMRDQPELVNLIDQAYDFAVAELTTRIAFQVGPVRADLTVTTFCSRTEPALVCQETQLVVNRAASLHWRPAIDPASARGRVLRRRASAQAESVGDGVMLWGSPGDLASCGLALSTEAPAAAERSEREHDEGGALGAEYTLKAAAGRALRFRQMVALVPSVAHDQPDAEALRLLARAKQTGFEGLRRANHEAWAQLWRGRVRLVGAPARWQALADAAFFYLNSSTHGASPASTSIFGLATWHDYHYYFGHVMWDVDAFATPVLSVLQPQAARALLHFRSEHLEAARANAKLLGLPGLRFPWEASASSGQEATPGPAAGATREDHLNLHVARAFDLYADVTGDDWFRRERVWPVLAGIADWIVGRVTPKPGGYDWLAVGGAAERAELSNNDALTNMLGVSVLRRAAAMAAELGIAAPPAWEEVAAGLKPPMRADGAIAAHDGYHTSEEQGAAPTPLMAIFPYGEDLGPETERRTLELYLRQWRGYVGAPMLAAFYPAWALMLGERELAATLFEEGYGAYQTGRFAQTLEYRLDKVPDGVAAGPFFANICAFLTTLIYGLTGVRPGAGAPRSWARRPVVLPPGWTGVECDQLWIQGRPARLRARHGAERAEVEWW